MTDRKTNLPEEPIFEEAEDDGCPSIENSSHLSVPTVEENKDFSEYNGEEAEEVVVPEKPASAYATVSIMCLCMAFGGFMSGWDTVIVVYMVGIVIQIASIDKWYQYFIGRIIAGIGAGSISVLAPMLISETAPKHIRGTLLACWQLMVTFAIFLGYCTNYGTKAYSNSVQWRVPLGLCFAWAIIMIGGMTFVPESPRFLVQVGKIEQAKASFAKSNKLSVDDPAVVAEIDLLVAGVEAEEAMGTASWKELFSRKTKVFQRLTMTVVINSLQQLTGDNYFFYYGTTIFKSVGMNDSFETSIVLGIVNFASCFFSLYSVDKLGRRRCLLLGAATMTACMVIYASVGVTRLYPNGKSQPSSKGAETKGLTLEEVDEMWMDGVLSWKSESWVPASRRDGDYDNEKLQHDEKPFYKRMF
ncbi:hexose transporter HXT8 [Saccharomyces cerevisiae]|nr:hexose transporter HXT8 [Saccharomyces cerevisiae]